MAGSPPRHRGRRARLHHVAHHEPPHQQGRAHAHAHRRADELVGIAEPSADRPGRAPGRLRLRRRRRRVRHLPAHGRDLGPAALVLAGAGAPDDSWRRDLDCSTRPTPTGCAMTGQVAPRAVGVLLGLQCTLHPLLVNPVYRESPTAARRAGRRAQRPGSATRCSTHDGQDAAAGCSRTFDACSSWATRPTTSPTRRPASRARAERGGRRPARPRLRPAARRRRARVLYLPFLNYADGNLDAVGEMLAHPNTVLGLGDGGAHVGTICDASFPTTLLTLWGRDRDPAA